MSPSVCGAALSSRLQLCPTDESYIFISSSIVQYRPLSVQNQPSLISGTSHSPGIHLRPAGVPVFSSVRVSVTPSDCVMSRPVAQHGYGAMPRSLPTQRIRFLASLGP